MELEWMSKHRTLIEKLIKYGNAYANSYRLQHHFEDVVFSAAQIQTLEYILENEERDEKMSQIASRLGVRNSAFSKNVKKLMEQGLLEKYRYTDNQKNIYVKATEKGKSVYLHYVQVIYEECFRKMFEIADQINPEELKRFEEMLDIFTEVFFYLGTSKPEPRKLVKIDDH
jgi:DNA-binding MarR family transcriptional regulator